MLDEAIDLLNKYGWLTPPLLMKKFKITYGLALFLMEMAVEDYENIKFKTFHMIYIEGREVEWLKINPKKPRVRLKKQPRWKDVTKP